MIVQITGVLKNKNIDEIVIEANGLGYLCHISNNTFNRLPSVGENITIPTFLHIMENKHTLYGFSDTEERKLFKMLSFNSDRYIQYYNSHKTAIYNLKLLIS